MPVYCLGCSDQKRSKDSKFYNASSLPLVAVNNLRQTFNAKKRKLETISEIPESSKICKSCYDMSHKNAIVSIDLKCTGFDHLSEGVELTHSMHVWLQNIRKLGFCTQ